MIISIQEDTVMMVRLLDANFAHQVATQRRIVLHLLNNAQV